MSPQVASSTVIVAPLRQDVMLDVATIIVVVVVVVIMIILATGEPHSLAASLFLRARAPDLAMDWSSLVRPGRVWPQRWPRLAQSNYNSNRIIRVL